jgi:hypothetical protein
MSKELSQALATLPSERADALEAAAVAFKAWAKAGFPGRDPFDPYRATAKRRAA